MFCHEHMTAEAGGMVRQEYSIFYIYIDSAGV
jgi:hypothetical protein